jgi:hypothetical protein
LLTVVESVLPVVKVVDADPPGGKYKSIESGTALPIWTVTVMVWGASTALGSDTVTVPVYSPRARDEVLNAILTKLVAVTDAAIQETFAPAESERLPSPALVAATSCWGPFCPVATNTGPTAAVESRSFGAAVAIPQHMILIKTLREIPT